MKIAQLRYALAVRKYGAITKAAERCHVSQPTLSEAVRSLENELEVELFERSGAGTSPTTEGRKLLRQAEIVIEEARQLEQMAADIAEQTLPGTFRIGVIATIGPYLLPQMLDGFEAKYPHVHLEIHEGLTSPLLDKLRQHRLEIAIIARPWEIGAGLESFPIFEEPFYVAMPKDHPLSEKQKVSSRELAGDDLLLLDEGHCLRDHALEVCKSSFSHSQQSFRGGSLETIKRMVAANHGVSLVPELAAHDDDSLVYRPLDPPEGRQVCLVAREAFPNRAGLEDLVDFLRSRATN